MNTTKNDAETALRDAGKAEEHSLTLFHYEMASPYLLLWGALWIIAGIISVMSPENTGTGWIILNSIGIAATGYLRRRLTACWQFTTRAIEVLRYMATVVVLALFLTMTFAIFNPVSGIQIQSFITVLLATIYMILGFWTGYRLTVVGAVLACLVIGAIMYTPSLLPSLVSVLGGGALILGGLWMRRA